MSCHSRCRKPLETGLKLAVTLRFLASGDSYRSLAFAFRVPHNTISLFVPKVCQAIVDEYLVEQMSTPTTPDEWRQVVNRFSTRWNYHHCCGAIDGKHVAIKCPADSGTLHYNYKGYFSIVLLAIVDGNYKYLWADVGSEGSASDAGIFNLSLMRQDLEEGRVGFPPPEPLPGQDFELPYFFCGGRRLSPAGMDDEASCREAPDPQGASLQLPDISRPAGGGKRIWYYGTQVAVPPHDIAGGTRHC